jgi:hypothetical protein
MARIRPIRVVGLFFSVDHENEITSPPCDDMIKVENIFAVAAFHCNRTKSHPYLT